MTIDKKRIAPYGLYLALIAIVLSVGIYIVQRGFTIYLQISLGLILLGIAFFGLMDPQRVQELLSGRQARYGSNALVLSVSFVGILVVINYLGFQYPQRWDLTEDQENTFAQETIETIKALPEPVTVTGFFSPDRSIEQARTILDTYKFYSDGNFEYGFVDPLTNPVLAEQAGISRDGTIVIRMGDRQELVTTASELQLTGALVRLMSEEQKVVYFLTGHGEYNPEETGDQGYDRTKRNLESKNYSVQLLNLLSINQIPTDAAAIIIAGPVQPISETEVDLIDDYLNRGGALIVMQEPIPFTEFGENPDPLGEYLSSNWNITLGDDVVVDLTSAQPYVTYADNYGNHPITQRMERVSAAFPTTRSVSASDSVDGLNPVEIIYTAPQSWAETDLEALDAGGEVSPQEGQDILGPVPITVVVESNSTDSRVAVFGDADFATD
ncbi:MAG: GldG family protein, partial [Anaerolineales bacterium]